MSAISALLLLSLAGGPEPAVAPADTTCPILLPNDVPVQGRQSPLDSLTFSVAGQPVKVCYGRPSLRGRKMLGGTGVPYGKLWRTGANEPTVLFTPVALDIAGVKVPPGKYSLYSVPGPKEWEIIVNRSTSQWGHEGQYSEEVRAQEVGRAKVPAGATAAPVETFTISAEPAGAVQNLVLTWEGTRLAVPVRPAS